MPNLPALGALMPLLEIRYVVFWSHDAELGTAYVGYEQHEHTQNADPCCHTLVVDKLLLVTVHDCVGRDEHGNTAIVRQQLARLR